MKAFLAALLHDPVKGLAALLGLVTATIGVVLGGAQVWGLLFKPTIAERSKVIIVDTSAAMNKPFGKAKMTRYKAAVDEISAHVLQFPHEVFALRFTGGTCSDGVTDPSVGFGTGNGAEIVAALDEMRPRGRSTFATTVGQAANDFQESDSAERAKVHSIWVFLGTGVDACEKQSAGAQIEAALEGLGTHVRFDFFALNTSRSGLKAVRALVETIQKQKYDSKVFAPATVRDLQDVVAQASQGELASAQAK